MSLTGFSFPEDHGPHDNASKEWWYFSGVLNDERGNIYSYCCIVFRFLSSQVWVFNMTNLETGKPMFQKVEVYPKSESEHSRYILDLRMEDRYLRNTSENTFVFGINEPFFSLELTLLGLKPPTTHGDGTIPMGEPGESSFYYSISRMTASGKMVVGNENLALLGDAWMDHQWGSWGSGNRYDWFSFRFDDGADLMLYRFRDEEGKTLDQYLIGTYVDKEGNFSTIKEFQAEPLGHYWMNEDSAGKYPLCWRVRVPSLGIDITTEAIVDDQFFWLDQKHLVWEGACRIISGNRRGYCFLEMVGY